MAITNSPKRQRFWLIVIAFVLANLVGWVVGMLCLGGDAVSGYAADGKYYVGSHGTYAEVSEAAWIYSMVHTVLLAVSVPITAVCGYWATRWDSPRTQGT
jgi:hypothetical protein